MTGYVPLIHANPALRHFHSVVMLVISCVLFGIIFHVSDTQAGASEKQFSSKMDFLASYLGEEARSETQTLWLTPELKNQAKEILEHRYSGLRTRYWGENQRSVWILDEIGKELPITIGVVVENNKILNVHILKYRESRGGEVRYPFFTEQFIGLGLKEDKKHRLNAYIDGITGATLSVAAVRKIAILALVFHQHTPFGNNTLDQQS